MRVEPYKRIDAVEFGITRNAVETCLGKPKREGVTRKGMVELEYSGAFYRFNAEGFLAEITIDAPVVKFGSVSIPFMALGPYLKQHDSGVFERAGFIVSPAYGVAFDPNFASWVTAFPHESLSLWQSVSTH